jgi:hypothetical protein
LRQIFSGFIRDDPRPSASSAFYYLSSASPIGSEDQLQGELDLARINSRTIDHAVSRRPELRPRRVPDWVIREIEDLGSELEVL